jgi:hypothetical protein
MMDSKDRYKRASFETADNLKDVIESGVIPESTQLTPPEVDAVVEQVSESVPAGNVPGLILKGLARLPGNRLKPGNVQRDVDLLFGGVEQTIEKAAYLGLFAGPATVIWAYQNLLQLAGIEPGDAFPEGAWQFYVGYALRDDTARHTVETRGFDQVLTAHQIVLDQIERMSAWVMAAASVLHDYDGLVANEWRERVYPALLREVTEGLPEASYYSDLYRQWADIRPYGRGADAQDDETFALYRKNRFMHFMQNATSQLPEAIYREWVRRIREHEATSLPPYRKQMSLLAYLEPGRYADSRQPIPLETARIGLIFMGHYYLLPATDPATGGPIPLDQVINSVAAIAGQGIEEPGPSLSPIARIKRATRPALESRFKPLLKRSIDDLRSAPIILNFDQRSSAMPLADLRRAERGLGDHALTVFDTGESMVFDLSHIFFDGGWGAAISEIMTNEALAWAVYLHQFPVQNYVAAFPRSLDIKYHPDDVALINDAKRCPVEASAETENVNLKAIYITRKLFKRRTDLIQLTVNDLLILYRAIHAATYQPSETLIDQLKVLAQKQATQPTAQAAYKAIMRGNRISPSVQVPVDVSLNDPRERVHPMSFEVPLERLDLLDIHERTIASLSAYERGEREGVYEQFDQLQRSYLAALAGFGEVLSRTKEMALAGESEASVNIQMMAHLPPPLQKLMEGFSGKFEWMNDIIKGREVFSNVGKVSPSSSLTRFLTAKDDNDRKELVWGVLTDRTDQMYMTLRDFRPHVHALHAIDEFELANAITQDYLDAYAEGLNRYIGEVHRITVASRETKISIRYPSRQQERIKRLEREAVDALRPGRDLGQSLKVDSTSKS